MATAIVWASTRRDVWNSGSVQAVMSKRLEADEPLHCRCGISWPPASMPRPGAPPSIRRELGTGTTVFWGWSQRRTTAHMSPASSGYPRRLWLRRHFLSLGSRDRDVLHGSFVSQLYWGKDRSVRRIQPCAGEY